jgi:hypothetical protein
MKKRIEGSKQKTGKIQDRKVSQKQAWEKPILEAIGSLKEIVQAKGITSFDGGSQNRKQGL